MRHVVAAVGAMVLLLALVLGTIALTAPEPPAQAAAVVECEVVAGNATRVVCTAAGLVVLDTALDVPTVTLPPVTVSLPPVTVTDVVPGPVKTITLPPLPNSTVTIRPPAVTATVTAPGATATVTAPPVQPTSAPTATVTKTIRVTENGKTKTLTSAPEQTTITSSPTATTTTTTSGQDGSDDGTVEPGGDFFSLDIDPDDDNLTAGEAGLGILALLGIIGLFFLGLYSGYYLGFKNKETDDTHFMRALRDSILTR